jgi:hypothetical protein
VVCSLEKHEVSLRIISRTHHGVGKRPLERVVKARTVLILAIAFAVVFLVYDVRSLIVHGFDLDKHVPFLVPSVLLFFSWCTFKIDQVTCPKPVEIAPEDLPEGVIPIGRYLRKTDDLEHDYVSESSVPVGYTRTKDGLYIVPQEVAARVNAPDGLGG